MENKLYPATGFYTIDLPRSFKKEIFTFTFIVSASSESEAYLKAGKIMSKFSEKDTYGIKYMVIKIEIGSSHIYE